MNGRLALGVLFLVAGGASAQAPAFASEPAGSGAWPRTLDERFDAPAPSPELECDLFAAHSPDPRAEELAALLATEPPPVSRETLDDDGSHRYLGLPGGIVLGLSARMPAGLEGARLARDERGVLGLRLDARCGGGFVRAPAIAPEELRACARFVQDRLDGLIDMDSETQPRLAPAFAGSALAELLARMDEVPHRAAPETRAWKTLIVDRDTRVELRGDALAFAADLEVRCYDAGGRTGWARRVLAIEAPAADFVGPRLARDLGGELAPLAEVAGWLGFLRWAERADPVGFAALCR